MQFQSVAFNEPGIILILSSFISLYLCYYSWKKRDDHNSRHLSYLMAAITLWSFTYGLELFQTDFFTMKMLTFISYFGISTIPVFWFIFSLGYSGESRFLTKRNKLLLFIFPLFVIFMVGTNDFHNLFYSSVQFETFGNYSFQKIESGPLWWMNILYSHILILSAVILMVRHIFRVSKDHRRHILFFLSGAALPYIANTLYVLGFRPYGFLDITPIAFIFMGVVLSIGVHAVKLFDITPVALEVLFNTIPDAIIVVDKDQKVVNSNSKGKEILKLGEFKKHLEHGFKNNSEIYINGCFYFCTKSLILNSNNQNIKMGAVVVFKDITELKRATEELEKARDMADLANKAKTEFLTNMSHELRTPLNGVIGFTDLLLMSNLDESNMEYARNVKESGISLLKLVDRVLDYSLYEKGDTELNISKCNLPQLIHSASSEIESNLKNKNLNLNIEIDRNLPQKVYVDKDKLLQILGNLLDNAVKFTEKGEVTLKVEFSQHENHTGCFRFTVSDTGIGIKEEDKSKLLTPFVQIDGSLTRKQGGVGLGLIISSLLVEKMGGKLDFESEAGIGSEFYFTIVSEYE